MTTQILLQWALVLLPAPMAFSLDCHFQRSKGNWEILQRLGNLGGKFPLQCLKDRRNFRLLQFSKIHQFPKEHVLVANQEVLQQIFTTFSLNVPQPSWSESSLERLLSGLYQQMKKTGVCLEQEINHKGPSALQREDIRLGIKNYFQGIHDYL